MEHPAWSRQYDDRFVALDFETAASERSSACAVAAVTFEGGEVVGRLRTLIRPPGNEYDGVNIGIHGIGPADTTSAPAFPDAWREIDALTRGQLVLAHNSAFDMSVLRRSAEFYSFAPSDFAFACTYRLSRSQLADAGEWKLDSLAREYDGELHRWLQVNGHDDRCEHMQPTDGGVRYGSEAEFG